MGDNLIIEQVRRSIEARRSRPADERWRELVERGAIDSKGRVLLGAEAAPTPMPKPEPNTGSRTRAKGKARR